jgi:hypothetical protein
VLVHSDNIEMDGIMIILAFRNQLSHSFGTCNDTRKSGLGTVKTMGNVLMYIVSYSEKGIPYIL